jgi:hypothetical protein
MTLLERHPFTVPYVLVCVVVLVVLALWTW